MNLLEKLLERGALRCFCAKSEQSVTLRREIARKVAGAWHSAHFFLIYYMFISRATPVKGQAQGLLECWLDPVPVVAKVRVRADLTTAEKYIVRAVVDPRVNT